MIYSVEGLYGSPFVRLSRGLVLCHAFVRIEKNDFFRIIFHGNALFCPHVCLYLPVQVPLSRISGTNQNLYMEVRIYVDYLVRSAPLWTNFA